MRPRYVPVCAPFEPLEARVLLSAADVQSLPPPWVKAAYVSGSAWTQSFKDYAATLSPNSSSAYGLELGAGALLPWVNLDRISLRFSDDMIVEADDLRVRGVNVPETVVSSVSYEFDPARYEGVATWTLAAPLRADRVVVEVASGADGVRDRNNGVALDGEPDGVPGGDFRRRFDVLPGSMHGYAVSPLDTGVIRPAVGTSTTNLGRGVGEGPGRYQIFYDVNGDGRVNIVDLVEVRSRWGTRLPLTQPTIASLSPATTSLLARGLFSTDPVLA